MINSKVIFAVLLALLAGGFLYLAFTDVPVTQRQIEKEIPLDRFS